jgi:hypothetical protein
MHSGPDVEAAMGTVAPLFIILLMVAGVVILASLAFMIYCWWRIFSKAGYSGALGLLVLVPGFGGLIVLCILAFGSWPALREAEQLRREMSNPPRLP